MAILLLLHVANEEAVLIEVEDMPAPGDVWIKGTNPRWRDNKELHYVLPEVNTVIFPAWRINFIEVMPGEEAEQIITTVRGSERSRDY